MIIYLCYVDYKLKKRGKKKKKEEIFFFFMIEIYFLNYKGIKVGKNVIIELSVCC